MASSTSIELAPNQSIFSWSAARLWYLFFAIRFALSRCIVALLNKIHLSSYLVAWLHKVAAHKVIANDYSRAEIAYRLILRLKPDDREAIIQLADLFDDLAMLRMATLTLENWLERFPNDVRSHIILSKYYSHMSETAKAKEHLDVASGLAPNSADLLEAFGYFYRWNGNLAESTRFFNLALNERQKPSTLFLLAGNLIDAREDAEAKKLLEQASRLAPNFAGFYFLLALNGYYRDLSHPHIVFMKNRLGNSDLDPVARCNFHFSLGAIYERLALWDDAFAHFKAGNDITWKRFQDRVSIKGWTVHVNKIMETFDSVFLEPLTK